MDFDAQYIELYCKLNVVSLLEIYDPRPGSCAEDHVVIDVDKSRNWFFALEPERGQGDGRKGRINIVAEYSPDMKYRLYGFDPEAEHGGFHSSNWNDEEFESMISELGIRMRLRDLLAKLKSSVVEFGHI